MAATRKQIKSRPGFEPSRGFPDPNVVRDAAPVGQVTHYPNRDRTVCGLVLTDAAAYDTVNPTCTTCGTWLAHAIRATQALQPASAPAPAAAPPAPPAAAPARNPPQQPPAASPEGKAS